MYQYLQYQPGDHYLYSDVNFIVIMYIVGHLSRTQGLVSSSDLIPGCDQGGVGSGVCYFEAYVRRYIFKPLTLQRSMFITSFDPVLAATIPPAWNDSVYEMTVIRVNTDTRRGASHSPT